MKEYLYVFGYEDFEDYRANKKLGTDSEKTGCFRIIAGNSDGALNWGRRLSKWYIQGLFHQKGVGQDAPDWIGGKYACWIENEPDSELQEFSLALKPINQPFQGEWSA